MGHKFVPIHPGTKVAAVKWKRYQTESPTEADYVAWFGGTQNNIAIMTGDLVIFDCDDPNKVDLVLDHCGDTPWRVRTPRGGLHLGYRKRQGLIVGTRAKIKGQPIDIRAEGGLALVPFSMNAAGTPYTWEGPGLLPVKALPVAKIGWTRERKRSMPARPFDSIPMDPRQIRGKIHNIFAYLLRIPSLQGQFGSKGCYKVCALLREEGYSPLEAWLILLWWNERVPQPKWREHELLHKLESAYRMRLSDVSKGRFTKGGSLDPGHV